MARDHDCTLVAKTEHEDPSRKHGGGPAARNAAANGKPRAACLKVLTRIENFPRGLRHGGGRRGRRQAMQQQKQHSAANAQQQQ